MMAVDVRLVTPEEERRAQAAHILALWMDPAAAMQLELQLRRVVEQGNVYDPDLYLCAANLIRRAQGHKLDAERAEHERDWRELDRLRATQAVTTGWRDR